MPTETKILKSEMFERNRRLMPGTYVGTYSGYEIEIPSIAHDAWFRLRVESGIRGTAKVRVTISEGDTAKIETE
jgi:hypothetical protein